VITNLTTRSPEMMHLLRRLYLLLDTLGVSIVARSLQRRSTCAWPSLRFRRSLIDSQLRCCRFAAALSDVRRYIGFGVRGLSWRSRALEVSSWPTTARGACAVGARTIA